MALSKELSKCRDDFVDRVILAMPQLPRDDVEQEATNHWNEWRDTEFWHIALAKVHTAVQNKALARVKATKSASIPEQKYHYTIELWQDYCTEMLLYNRVTEARVRDCAARLWHDIARGTKILVLNEGERARMLESTSSMVEHMRNARKQSSGTFTHRDFNFIESSALKADAMLVDGNSVRDAIQRHHHDLEMAAFYNATMTSLLSTPTPKPTDFKPSDFTGLSIMCTDNKQSSTHPQYSPSPSTRRHSTMYGTTSAVLLNVLTGELLIAASTGTHTHAQLVVTVNSVKGKGPKLLPRAQLEYVNIEETDLYVHALTAAVHNAKLDEGDIVQISNTWAWVIDNDEGVITLLTTDGMKIIQDMAGSDHRYAAVRNIFGTLPAIALLKRWVAPHIVLGNYHGYATSVSLISAHLEGKLALPKEAVADILQALIKA